MNGLDGPFPGDVDGLQRAFGLDWAHDDLTAVGRLRRVLDQLFFHAWRFGSSAISGRMDPEFVTDFSEERCLFSFNGPRVLVSSKRADLREAIQQGDAFLTRLEGEWWMRLQGG